MIEVRETTIRDLALVQELWADGDVMRFVGFPEGLRQTDEEMLGWFRWIESGRPARNHYAILEDGNYCGEAFTGSIRSSAAPRWTSSSSPLPEGGASGRRGSATPSGRPFETARRASGSTRIRRTAKRSPCTGDWAFGRRNTRRICSPARRRRTRSIWNCGKHERNGHPMRRRRSKGHAKPVVSLICTHF